MEIIEGKREKKKVERLVQSGQLGKPKERLKIESGEYYTNKTVLRDYCEW